MKTAWQITAAISLQFVSATQFSERNRILFIKLQPLRGFLMLCATAIMCFLISCAAAVCQVTSAVEGSLIGAVILVRWLALMSLSLTLPGGVLSRQQQITELITATVCPAATASSLRPIIALGTQPCCCCFQWCCITCRLCVSRVASPFVPLALALMAGRRVLRGSRAGRLLPAARCSAPDLHPDRGPWHMAHRPCRLLCPCTCRVSCRCCCSCGSS